MKLAIISTYFNPLNLRSRREIFKQFYKHICLQVPTLHIAELLYDRPSDISVDHKFQFHAKSIMWHRENLINQTIRHLENYDAFCWVDCDILFEQADWYDRLVQSLKEFPLVQPFHQADWLDTEGQSNQSWYNYAFGNRWGRTKEWYTTGFSWAARKEVLEATGGWYEYHVVGGADYLTAQAACGIMPNIKGDYGDFVLQRCKFWHKAVQGKIGYVEGIIKHLYHGNTQHRQHAQRMEILRDYHPDKDLVRNEDGIFEWSSQSQLAESVKQYFVNRREDVGDKIKLS